MNDLLFFPLAFTLALAIIASAALPGRDRTGCGSVSGAGSDYKKIEVEGDDLCRLNAAGQATLSQIDVEDHIVAMQIRAGAGLLGDRPDRNPHFRLAADLEQQFSGNRIRVSIEARPAPDEGALSFEANYSAGQEGNSGWQTFRLEQDYQTYKFIWDVPKRTIADQAVDYLAIRPVVPEKYRTVEIRSVKFERLGKTSDLEKAEAAKAKAKAEAAESEIPEDAPAPE